MKLSSIIITKNEEKNIESCIRALGFSDEIIVIDNNSIDETVRIAKELGAKVYSGHFYDFSSQRNEGLKHTNGDFVLYMDADEKVDEKLKSEIQDVLKGVKNGDVFRIRRKNYYFHKYEWKNYQQFERLFKRSFLKEWKGKVHESPVYEGTVSHLSGFIIHHTHNDLTSMTDKTIEWSAEEAQIRFESKHPKMALWRFPRVMIPTFLNFYIKQGGWKLGTAGLIESIFQTYSIFVTYARLWELQEEKR